MAEGAPSALHLCLRATPSEVRAALSTVTRTLRADGPRGDGIERLELALAEALNNVVEHAYAARVGVIELTVEPGPNAIACELRDTGDPMPDGALPSGDAPPLDGPADAMPEGGFGWLLIRTLSSDLHYERRCAPPPARNVLSFRIALS